MFSKDKNYGKVTDNCHFTDKYRYVAHSICNFRFNVHNEITVDFSEWVKLWLPLHNERTSKWVWGTIWVSLGKHR